MILRCPTVVFLGLFCTFCCAAQETSEFVFELKFRTNVQICVEDKHGKVLTRDGLHNYRLEKFDSSCRLGEILYKFKRKDTLLIRYLTDFKTLFEAPGFDQRFNATCPHRYFSNFVDGIKTTFIYQSDSFHTSIEVHDGNCEYNSLYNSIISSFFNIAYYIISQPSMRGKLSILDEAVLDFDNENTGRSYPTGNSEQSKP